MLCDTKPPPLVSVRPTTSSSSSTTTGSTSSSSSIINQRNTDKEIVRQLHPILYRLKPYSLSDATELLNDIDKIEQLQRSSSIEDETTQDPQQTSEILEILWKQLRTIFVAARDREAAHVPTITGTRTGNRTIQEYKDVPDQYRIAAIEMRHAVLYGQLQLHHHTMDANSSEQVSVYREGVADLQNPGEVGVVVLRQEDQRFWDRCIQLISDGHPVCGVGNPGIGKTTTSIYLLQLLIHHKKPVVYTIRQKEQGSDDIFYEMIPILHGDDVHDVAITLYKMPHERVSEIPGLKLPNAVYVVDPGDFAGSCDVSKIVRPAQFIMNASNDETHWGGPNFCKMRSGVKRPHWGLGDDGPVGATKTGKIIHASRWTPRQLLLAKNYLFNELDDVELLRRFRIVGGSIRDILEFNEDMFREKVAAALNIDDVTVQGLVDGTYQFLYKPKEPSSVLVGLGPADKKNLELTTLVLKSDFVEEQLAKKHLRISWYKFLNEENAGNRGNLFESYLRDKFSNANVHFPQQEVRESVRTVPTSTGKSGKQRKNYVPVVGGVTIGSKRTIIRVLDMNACVQKDLAMEYMFYSKNQSEPLIDMIFKVPGGYDAIQSTVGKMHGSTTEKMKTLKTALRLKENETLRIFVAVPEVRYSEFVTDPVNPLLDEKELLNVRIFHVSIGSCK